MAHREPTDYPSALEEHQDLIQGEHRVVDIRHETLVSEMREIDRLVLTYFLVYFGFRIKSWPSFSLW